MNIQNILAMIVVGFSGFAAHVSYAAPANWVVSVNGEKLTEDDLKISLAGLPEGQREKYLSNRTTKLQAIESLVNQELLVQEAKKEKLQDTSVFQARIEAFKKQVLASMWMEKRIEPQVTESAARDFYTKNKRRFSTGQVHVQHILLENENDAKAMKTEASKPGADFQALAEKHSKDPSAKNNRGDVGWISWGQMVPEFEDAAFNGIKDSVVGPVKTAYGFHVIKVLEKKAGKPLGYTEVEQQVRTALRQQLLQATMARLKTSATIEVR